MNHLKACMEWLVRAQEVNSGGGVSAMYYCEEKRWEADYPETTGFIIPTFLAYARHAGDDSYLYRAIEMGKWLIDIQLPEGGVLGTSGSKPQIFNTSQVILGWMALYMEMYDERYLNAARWAADWIMSKQDADGAWRESTYAGPKAYHIRVAWALFELRIITEDKKYERSCNKSFSWALSQVEKNGWFRNNNLGSSGKSWTHLIGYALVGLMKLMHIEIDRALDILFNAASGIRNFYVNTKYFMPGTFDSKWNSEDEWSCLTGNAQLAFFLHRMSEIDGDERGVGSHIVEELKVLQLNDASSSDTYGGLLGSFPKNGGYMPNIIPNWGVKFFADALLQKEIPYHEQKFLG